jgi:hypothetical protein
LNCFSIAESYRGKVYTSLMTPIVGKFPLTFQELVDFTPTGGVPLQLITHPGQPGMVKSLAENGLSIHHPFLRRLALQLNTPVNLRRSAAFIRDRDNPSLSFVDKMTAQLGHLVEVVLEVIRLKGRVFVTDKETIIHLSHFPYDWATQGKNEYLGVKTVWWVGDSWLRPEVLGILRKMEESGVMGNITRVIESKRFNKAQRAKFKFGFEYVLKREPGRFGGDSVLGEINEGTKKRKRKEGDGGEEGPLKAVGMSGTGMVFIIWGIGIGISLGSWLYERLRLHLVNCNI